MNKFAAFTNTPEALLKPVPRKSKNSRVGSPGVPLFIGYPAGSSEAGPGAGAPTNPAGRGGLPNPPPLPRTTI